MTDNLKQFLLAVAADQEWIQWVNALAGRQEAIEAAVKKAAELGLPLSPADFEDPGDELSDDELAGVAGGACGCVLSGTGLGAHEPTSPDSLDSLITPIEPPATPDAPPLFVPVDAAE